MSAAEPAHASTPAAQRIACVAGTAVAACAAWGSHAVLAPLDAGDFVTASWALGVPHSPGFPLQTMLGHALAWLPLGSVATRVGLISALAAGAVAWAVVRLAHRLVPCRATALAAAVAVALIFGLAAPLGLAARMPEVYLQHTALLLGGLLLAHAPQRTPAHALLATLCWAAALCNHPSAALLVPCGAWVLLPRWRHQARVLVTAVALAAIVGASWFYLMAAAASDPPHNWGDPATPARMWHHMSAANVRESFDAETSVSAWARWMYTRQWWQSLGAGVGALSAAGLLGLALRTATRRAPAALAISLFAMVAIEVAWAAFINPMGIRDWQNGQVALAIGAIALGATVGGVIERFGRAAARAPAPADPDASPHEQAADAADIRPLPWGSAAAIGVALVGLQVIVLPEPVRSLRQPSYTADAALWHLGHVAPASITTTLSDDLTSATLYATVVGDARPDVTAFGRWLLGSPESLPAHLAHWPVQPVPSLLDPEGAARWQALPRAAWLGQAVTELLQVHLGQRTIAWEVAGSLVDLPPDLPWVLRWPVAEVLPMGAQTPAACMPSDRSYCPSAGAWTAPERVVNDIFAARWLSAQWATEARLLAQAGEWQPAYERYNQALALRPGSGPVRASMAVCLAAVGELPAALALSEEALQFDPFSQSAWRNGTRYATALQRADALQRLNEHGRRMHWTMPAEPPP
jgi:hypothetical protein